MTAMQTPAFFNQVPTIVVHDALAQTLGALHDAQLDGTPILQDFLAVARTARGL